MLRQQMKVSTIIDRPPDVVWQFYAVNHLRNHPRWDPKMELWQLTDGPIGVGTRFRRRHTRLETPIEGTMEIVEFEPNRSMGGVIHDATPAGPLEVRSRMSVEPHGEGGSQLTVEIDLPGREASMDPSMVEASLAKMKQLIEGET
jgi:hypothetical protein